MIPCAHLEQGACRARGNRIALPLLRSAGKRRAVSGFTLIEIIMVLVIIAILAGLSMPAVHSAFTEQALRNDSHQLALMVKTAMIQTSEQHRGYVIDLTATSMALHPAGTAAIDAADSDASEDTTDATTTSTTNVEITRNLDPDNKLQAADGDKWAPMPDNTEWAFTPGELCPATRVRLTRGDAWVELSFNALTGNVENESSYMP